MCATKHAAGRARIATETKEQEETLTGTRLEETAIELDKGVQNV